MSLRETFSKKAHTFGGWCGIPSPMAAELVGRSGFDWVCIDCQHGLVGYDAMVPMLQALSITRTPAWVRVPWNGPDHIMKALDAGAEGVIVPMVGTAAEAAQAVDSVKYPPAGHRSWGPVRAAFDVPDYSAETANRRTMVAVMIETPDGVENLDEILDVPGVDAVYVGPADLGLSHGHKPGLDMASGSEHEQLILRVLDGCRRHEVIPGIHTSGVENAKRWMQAGFQMLTIASDGAFLRGGATAAVRELNGLTEAGEKSASPYS